MLRLFQGLRCLTVAASQPAGINAALGTEELSSALSTSLLPSFGATLGFATKAGSSKRQNEVARPLSPYTNFMKDAIPKLRKELPDAQPRQLMQEAAKRFRSLGDTERKVYVQKFEAQKAQYDASVNKAQSAVSTRILSARHLYIQDKFSHAKTSLGGSASAPEVLKELNKQWAGLSENERSPWEARASSMKSKTLSEREAAKKPMSLYNKYVKANFDRVRAQAPAGTPPTQLLQQIGKNWQGLSQAEKDAYKP